MKNAVEAARGFGNRIEIRTRTVFKKASGDDPEGLCIEFIDDGPGIPEDAREKIFHPYFTTKYSGTGLGLMIVKRIVEEHEGHIDIDSSPETGTRVSIFIPFITRKLKLLTE